MNQRIKCRNTRCESYGSLKPIFVVNALVSQLKEILEPINAIKPQYFKCYHCGDIAINND